MACCVCREGYKVRHLLADARFKAFGLMSFHRFTCKEQLTATHRMRSQLLYAQSLFLRCTAFEAFAWCSHR